MNATNAHLAGKLAETYVFDTFGVREGPDHEVKAMSAGTGHCLCRYRQMTWSEDKTFWVVKYDRDRYTHRLKSGPRKGRKTLRARLKIAEAFEQQRVEICVTQGSFLLQTITKTRRPLQVQRNKTKPLLYYWRLSWAELLLDCIPYEHRGVMLWRHQDLHPDQMEPVPVQLLLPGMRDDQSTEPAPAQPSSTGPGMFDAEDSDIPF